MILIYLFSLLIFFFFFFFKLQILMKWWWFMCSLTELINNLIFSWFLFIFIINHLFIVHRSFPMPSPGIENRHCQAPKWLAVTHAEREYSVFTLVVCCTPLLSYAISRHWKSSLPGTEGGSAVTHAEREHSVFTLVVCLFVCLFSCLFSCLFVCLSGRYLSHPLS